MYHLAVPGYIHTTQIDYLHHFWFLAGGRFSDRGQLLEEIRDLAVKQGFSRDARILVGYSSRSLFDVFLTHLGGKKICVTPFLHTGFQRIVDWNGYETYVIDVNDDCSLRPFDPVELRTCDAVLITHVFGNRFDVGPLVAAAREACIPVFEDCVQAGFFTAYPGNEQVDISVFSGGQDKLPLSFGGGIGIVRNPVYADLLAEHIAVLPEEGALDRLKHLLGKLPILASYNCRPTIWLILATLQLIGMPSFVMAEKFRKSIPGFIHDRGKYLKKPSIYQLLSMRLSLLRDYERYERECREKRALFLEQLDGRRDRYLPWHQALAFAESSNFYHHLMVDDPQAALALLDRHHFCCLPQQSWFVDAEKAPNAARIKDHLIILPSLMRLSPSEIKELADILQ